MTALWIRIVGAILALVGLLVILAAFGQDYGIRAPVAFGFQLLVGGAFVIFGAWLATGRQIPP
jgi:hypothetical protein